jgi:hypothetical protein
VEKQVKLNDGFIGGSQQIMRISQTLSEGIQKIGYRRKKPILIEKTIMCEIDTGMFSLCFGHSFLETNTEA